MYKGKAINVIMAVYNEERTLHEVIRRVLAQRIVDRLIIINDNSKDDSAAIMKQAESKDGRITILKNGSNMGKGYSVRRGIKEVKEGIIIIQDADLEYYPEDYPKLVAAVGRDSFVLGTRVRGDRNRKGYALSRFANAAFSSMFNILYGKGITDINTCYKVFRKDMLKGITLKENGFLLDPEIVIALVKKGYRIKEVDIRYKGRSYEEGKKITAKDAVDQGLYIISCRFKN